jgi:hypothetical protein
MSLEQPWTLARIYADLTTLRMVAQRLNVRIERVRRWVSRRATTRCPYPVTTLSGMDVYSMHEWQAWYERWKTIRGPERRGVKTQGYQPHPNAVAS